MPAFIHQQQPARGACTPAQYATKLLRRLRQDGGGTRSEPLRTTTPSAMALAIAVVVTGDAGIWAAVGVPLCHDRYFALGITVEADPGKAAK